MLPGADNSLCDKRGRSHILDFEVVGAIVTGREMFLRLSQCPIASEPFALFEHVQRYTNANLEQIKGLEQ